MIAELCHALRRRRGLIATGVLAVLAAQAADLLVPAALWYRLETVEVADFRRGGEIRVIAAREIRRPFDGSYQVTIWPDDSALPICRGSPRQSAASRRQSSGADGRHR